MGREPGVDPPGSYNSLALLVAADGEHRAEIVAREGLERLSVSVRVMLGRSRIFDVK
jgi:hypothetical protein